MGVILLTRRQQEVFDEALEQGSFTATSGHDKDICKNLVKKGRFFLSDYSTKEWVFKVTAKYLDKKSRKERGLDKPLDPIIQDTPKKKIKRPPAEYSNCISGNALISKILNDGK